MKHTKFEKIVTIVVVSATLAALLCSSTVFAGNNPKSWMEVVVMNSAGQDVPVILRNPLLNVQGAVQIANTEPIPVDGEVSVTDIQSPVDVNVDDSTPLKVEVTNPQSGSVSFDGEVTIDDEDPVNVDVSGWLHTTKTGTLTATIDSTNPLGGYPRAATFPAIDTEGYKEITIVFTTDAGGILTARFEIEGMSFKIDTVDYHLDDPDPYDNLLKVAKTYEVQGSELHITLWLLDGPINHPPQLSYYLTT